MVIGQLRNPAGPACFGPGSILAVNTRTAAVYTIAPAFTQAGTLVMAPNCIEMASDNADLMVGCVPRGSPSTRRGEGIFLHRVGIDGSIVGTLVADMRPGVGSLDAFDLDGDGTWILGGGTHVWSFDERTSRYATLYSPGSPKAPITALVLDPALPRGDIVLGEFKSTLSGTAILREANRGGVVATLATAGPAYVTGLEVDYTTGDYLASALGPGRDGTGGEFCRITKSGVFKAVNNGVTTMYRANGIYVDKEHLVWILTYDWRTTPIPTIASNYVCSLYKVDFQGVFITQYIYSSTLTRGNFEPTGLTRYGSRQVVCNGSGKPGTSVKVSFSSREEEDWGKAYQLLASFGYRNGMRFANGEYLDLTPDALFFLTASNRLPRVFEDFHGVLDNCGEVTATIRIPAGLPSGLGVPIYVSGVVIDPMAPGGVITVANTHWFTLK